MVMKYIIEKSASFQNENDKQPILINDTKVTYRGEGVNSFRYFRLDTSAFIIQPGHIMIDLDVISISDFSDYKERMTYLHSIGCTTFITAFSLDYEAKFNDHLMRAKHSLINSTIDFVLGLRIPITKLTSSLLRKCKKAYIPIIFVEITEWCHIKNIHWSGFCQEMFPYNIMIVPIWKVDVSNRKLTKYKNNWVVKLTESKIATTGSIIEHRPLDKNFLQNIGLFPRKGALQIGSDADYLMFDKEKFIMEDKEKTLHPAVVVSNGKVIKAGKTPLLLPGRGKEIQIKVPRKFTPIERAFKQTIDYIYEW